MDEGGREETGSEERVDIFIKSNKPNLTGEAKSMETSERHGNAYAHIEIVAAF